MPPKKQIIVVKSLRDFSPKKQLLVSRQLQDDEWQASGTGGVPESLEASHLGNHSPTKPMKLKNGDMLSRSILGDPAVYDNIERKQKEAFGATNNNSQSTDGSRVPMSRKSMRSSGRSSPQSAEIADPSAQRDEESNFESPSKYINTLVEQKDNAKKLQTKNYEQEAKLISFLPLHERLIFGKERKVLVKWQERQREWERIYADISSKIVAPGGHSLLMETTEEFRAKIEEYDLIQAAVPFKDKFGSSSWQMTLRGGSNRTVSVGHVFSGLECEVDRPIPHPPIIRKPIANKKFKRGTAPLEETKALVYRRRKLRKNIETIRPQTVTFDDAAQLVIQGVDLFDWAIETSKEYYSAKDNQDDINNEGKIAIDGAFVTDHGDHKKHSSLECDTSEIVFSTTVGKSTLQRVSLRNSGDVAIRYFWTPTRPDDRAEDANLSSVDKDTEIGLMLKSRISKLGGEARDRQIFRKRNNFYCCQQRGVILPGESVSTLFTFHSEIGGSFKEAWNLSCSPRVRFSILSQPTDEVKESGLIPFQLRSQCTYVDETAMFRSNLKQLMNASTFECMLKDELSKCFRRIRNSIKPDEVNTRKVVLFSDINRKVLNLIVGRLEDSLPIFVTIDRILLVERLCYEVSDFVAEVKAALFVLQLLESSSNMKLVRQIYGSLLGDDCKINWAKVKSWFRGVEADISTKCVADFDVAARQGDLDALAAAHCNPDKIESIANRLLPEGSLDVFDEVDISVFHPSWDFSVEGMLSRLNVALDSCVDIEQLEINLLARVKVYDKQCRKDDRAEALRLKRLSTFVEKAKANPDPLNPDDFDDDEEEEEEEEEEQEEEKDEDAEVPKHVLVVRSQAFISKCLDILAVAISTPFNKDGIEASIKTALCTSLDNFDDLRQAALESSGCATSGTPFTAKIPVIASPFTSAEGSAQWESIMNPPPVIEEVVDPKAKGKAAPPAKGKGAAEPVSSGPTPQQINGYYRTIHNSVRDEIINALCGVTDASDDVAASSNYINASQVRAVDVRQDDQSLGKIVLVNFPGYLFAESPKYSAFNYVRSEQTKYLTEVKNMADNGAHAFVLLYETPAQSYQAMPWTNSAESICNSLNSMNQASVQAKELVYSKKMKKWNIANDKAEKRMAKWKGLNFQKDPSAEEIAALQLAIAPVDDVILDVTFSVKVVQDVAEMKYLLNQLATEDVKTRFDRQSVSLTYERRFVTVFVVENIRLDGVVPAEESMKEEIEEFEDAPIFIGAEEYQEFRINKHERSRPHYTEVKVSCGAKVFCYADAASALVDLYDISCKSKFGCVWVDLSDEMLFDHHNNSCFQGVSLSSAKPKPLIDSRLLGQNARDAVLYSSLVHLVSRNNDSSSYNCSSSNNVDFMANLFPSHDFSASNPRSVVIVGGSIRSDKFRVIDELLNSVNCIAITGEMAIPFLSFTQSIIFSKYVGLCVQFRSLVQSIMAKSRARNIALLLPTDVLIGDDKLADQATRKLKVFNCFSSSNPIETRDDGFDYEGETKVTPVNDLAEKTCDKYIFDIGPVFIKNIQEQIAMASIAIVWGLAGVSECSSFQTGTKAIAESIFKVPGDKKTTVSKPKQSIIVGEDTVEWFTRFADPDNEYEGDLVKSGFVSHTNRNSTVLVGVLGLISSPSVRKGLKVREPAPQEKDINRLFVPEIVEDDEDE